MICENCGKVITGRGKRFCSNECQKEYEYHKWVDEWKANPNLGVRGSFGISSYLRKYLFEKYNSKCAICGWSQVNPYTGKIPLEVEHIDGNYKNNSEDNLTLLCPNCHSLTSTYKGANKGFGREERRKRCQ